MRSAIPALAVFLLCVATGLPVPGVAQETARSRTSFTGDFNAVVALTVVYGREPWNDLSATRRNTFENGQDFIEPLFDAAYVENGVEKHVVIATLSPRPRSQYNCHACSPMLGGAVFRRDGDEWRIESAGLKIEQGHAWLDGQHGRLALVRVGPDRYGLLHQIHDVGQGGESMSASLIVGVDGVLASRLVVPPIEGPGPGACGMPAQHLKVDVLETGADGTAYARTAGTANVDPGSGFYEIAVDAAWNDARCESLEGGSGAKWSGRTCQRISRYRYRDGAFMPSDSGRDACTLLPERIVDLRG